MYDTFQGQIHSYVRSAGQRFGCLPPEPYETPKPSLKQPDVDRIVWEAIRQLKGDPAWIAHTNQVGRLQAGWRYVLTKGKPERHIVCTMPEHDAKTDKKHFLMFYPKEKSSQR